MSRMLELVGRIPSLVMQAPPSTSPIQDSITEADDTPKVSITGDVRLQVTEQLTARGLVKGRYHIQTEDLQGPLQVIWTVEGQVLSRSNHEIEVAFDMRGIPAGALLTRLVSAQVTERDGQGRIVHSSIFIQIAVVKKAKGYSLKT